MSQFVLAVLFHGGLNHKAEKPLLSGRGSSGDGGGVGGDFLPGEVPLFFCLSLQVGGQLTEGGEGLKWSARGDVCGRSKHVCRSQNLLVMLQKVVLRNTF